MDLPDDWLNNAVGMFTPIVEDDTLFEVAGDYPRDGAGLRVLLARPVYLLAMKLKALGNLGRGDKDIADARALAVDLEVVDVPALEALYVSIHGERPREDVRRRLAAVLRRP